MVRITFARATVTASHRLADGTSPMCRRERLARTSHCRTASQTASYLPSRLPRSLRSLGRPSHGVVSRPHSRSGCSTARAIPLPNGVNRNRIPASTIKGSQRKAVRLHELSVRLDSVHRARFNPCAEGCGTHKSEHRTRIFFLHPPVNLVVVILMAVSTLVDSS